LAYQNVGAFVIWDSPHIAKTRKLLKYGFYHLGCAMLKLPAFAARLLLAALSGCATSYVMVGQARPPI
jgi:hypothetical protein